MSRSLIIQLVEAPAEVAEALKAEAKVDLEAEAVSEAKNVVATKVVDLQDLIALLDLLVQTGLIPEEEVLETEDQGMEVSPLVDLLSQKTRKVREETDLCNHIF
jgi:hypothetical protein